MKIKNASESLIYESLNVISQRFGEILQKLERLQQIDDLGNRAPIKSVVLAVRETRAWTMFEVLEILREREESEWTRLGRLRSAMEKHLEPRKEVQNRVKGQRRQSGRSVRS